MEVTIDVRKLMATLEVMNPEADFTITKSYLFDLVMGKEPVVEGFSPEDKPKARRGRKPNVKEPVEEESEVPTEPQLELADILAPTKQAHTLLAPTPAPTTRRVIVNTGGGKLSRDEKLAKREEMNQLRDIPTKELLARLTARQESPKDGNQFVHEGMDTSSGGELEIG